MINRDADGSGELDAQSCSLDFIKSETSTESDSVIISDGGAADGGPEVVQRSGGDGSSLSSPGLKSTLLPGGLVEPGSDVSLPVFPQMDIGKDVVVLDHGSQIILIFN